MNGMFMTEKVLKEDGTTYDEYANSISDSLVKHLLYYLSNKTAGIVFKQSSTSGGTSITFTPNYPESNAVGNLPLVSIYTETPGSRQLTFGGIIANMSGNVIRGRCATFGIWFDIWGRSTQETNSLAGLVKLLLDDAIHDTDFVFGRGIDDVQFRGSSNREFDISDNYVNDISHLDTSINMRRQQMLYDVQFNYRIGLGNTPQLGGIGTILEDLSTNKVVQSIGFNVDFA